MYSLWLSVVNAYTAPVLNSKNHVYCPLTSPPSCSVSNDNSCCYEATNGLFLSTQLWNTHSYSGPANSFTLHGLWSDTCLGGYRQFCNPSWEIGSPRLILEDLGKSELLSKMDTYWKNDIGADETLWGHEFNKHGTCMYTLDPSCYSGVSDKERVGDFFETAVRLFESLPTYKWLTEAGIYPDYGSTHKVADVENALSQKFGNKVYLICDAYNHLQQVWYFFHLEGSVASGNFIPVDRPTSSACRDGMRWLPKLKR